MTTLLAICTLSLILSPYFGAVYPTYTVTGTYYEVGYSVGKQAKHRIKEYLSMNDDINTIKQYIATTEGSNIFNTLIQYNEEIYPKYFEELQGISNGSNIDYLDILLINFEKELDAIMKMNNYSNHFIPSCSDMLVNNPSTFIGFGHNEDDGNISLSTAYFTNITYTETNNTIFAFNCAPGLLIGAISPGISISNKLVLSVNALSPSNVTANGRSITFISRDVLTAKSMQDAIDKVTNGKTSVGESFNIGYYGGDKINIVNIELSMDEYSVEYVNQSEYNEHFNKYLRLNVSQYTTPSSDARMNRTLEIIDEDDNGSLQTINQIVQILGDTKNTQYPIYRDPNSKNDITTLVTVIYDLKTRNAQWYEQCNPKICDPSMIIQF